MVGLDFIKLPQSKILNELDYPDGIAVRAQIIQEKLFLKRLYTDFYQQMMDAFGESGCRKAILEIGSGAGFIKEVFPQVLTSEIIYTKQVDSCLSAMQLPFCNEILDGIVMFDVFHHIQDVAMFLEEGARVLKPGGKIVMVEPTNTVFSRFIYQHFHHEDFFPEGGWQLTAKGPMSSANGALPWIVFERDRVLFEEKFPQLKILKIKKHTPLRYLLSGGLSLKQLVPACFYPLVLGIEKIFSPINPLIAMFCTIEIEKRS